MGIFYETLEREGKQINVNDTSVKVFFRKNNNGVVDSYLTMFAPININIEQGAVFTLNNKVYLVMKKLTAENEIYQKFVCVQTNQKVKFTLKHKDNMKKADLVEFDMFMIDSFSDKVNNDVILTVSSQSEFKLTLNNLTKRIKINDRFFAGYFGAVWKIIDINYKDNIVTLYCKRDTIQSDDDIENGIADSSLCEIGQQPDGDIKITPSYNEVGYYSLIHSDTQTFKSNIDKVKNPKWDITLDSQGIPERNYKSVINNNKGEFTVTNYTPSKLELIYTIKETTTGQIKKYKIKLASLF